MAFVGTIFWPLLILAGLQRGQADVGVPSLVFACVLYPIAVIAHEFGHAATACLMGLELGAIGIGSGRVLWKFEIGGLPIRIHMWPISGRVYFGASNTRLLRTRLWLATLMGPATNALLVAATAAWWAPLEAVFGTPAVTLWLVVNFLLAIINLIPQRAHDFDRVVRTDGLQLLDIPRKTSAELSESLFAARLVRAMSRFEDGDFVAARLRVTRALAEAPDNLVLRLMQSACDISTGEYRAGVEALEPFLGRAASEAANIRAAIYNNMAFGLVMCGGDADTHDPRVLEANRLSAESFLLYPCILEYRSTRAFVLTATWHAQEALQLLDYPLYEAATAAQRGHREAARALALRHLHRLAEAEQAAAMAVRLDPPILRVLQFFKFSPDPAVVPVALPPKPSQMLQPAIAEREPLDVTESILAVFAGVILLLSGALVGGLCVLLFYRQTAFPRILEVHTLIVLLVLGSVSVFGIVVGSRLAFGLPNRYGSILSPNAWIALTIVFSCVGLGITVTAFLSKLAFQTTLASAGGSFAFAWLCLKARAAALGSSRRAAGSVASG